MSDSALTVRTLTHDDYDSFHDVFTAAFLDTSREAIRSEYRQVFDPQRAHGVFDGESMIGGAAAMGKEITVPDGEGCPLAAVTAVGVQPGHRRRGVLRRLMRAQLDAVREHGEPIAALYASEGSIYGRFGYGVASSEARLSVPGRAAFRSTVDIDDRPIREYDRESALESMRQLYPRVVRDRVGWLSRDTVAWRLLLVNDRVAGSGAGNKPTWRYAVHPDGYVVYRAKPRWEARGPAYDLHIVDLVAVTPAAYAALWRYLLDLDLAGEVHWDKAAVDETVLWLLIDPRQAVRRVTDGLWVRIVDVERGLRARQYSAPADVVIEVSDQFCPWNEGRWHLRVDSDGAADVGRTNDSAHLAIDIADLGSVFLGGTTLSELARAGQVTELRPGAVRRASRAFATDTAPHCPEPF